MKSHATMYREHLDPKAAYRETDNGKWFGRILTYGEIRDIYRKHGFNVTGKRRTLPNHIEIWMELGWIAPETVDGWNDDTCFFFRIYAPDLTRAMVEAEKAGHTRDSVIVDPDGFNGGRF